MLCLPSLCPAGSQLDWPLLVLSGTPSDLLPTELRPCHYEPGSEVSRHALTANYVCVQAKIVRVLTSPDFVTYERLRNWDVHSLLKRVSADCAGMRCSEARDLFG